MKTPTLVRRLSIAAAGTMAAIAIGTAAAAPLPPAHTPPPALATARAIERGESAAAEATVDGVARALSGQHGYRADSFHVELYSVSTQSLPVVAASFDASLASQAYTSTAPLGGGTSTYIRDGGRQVAVVTYGAGASDGSAIVSVVRASR